MASRQTEETSCLKNKKKAKATGKRKSPGAEPSSDADPTKLSLSKTFKYDLTSKVYPYEQEADLLFNEAEKAAATGYLIKG